PPVDAIPKLQKEILLDMGCLVERRYIDEVFGISRRRDLQQIAQELGLGKNQELSPADTQRLQELYKERTGHKLSDQQLKEDLDLVPGRTLSADEMARLNELKRSMSDSLDEQEITGLHEDLQVTREELAKLIDNPDGATKLLQRLSNHDEFYELWPRLFRRGDTSDLGLEVDRYLLLLHQGKALPADVEERLVT